MGLGLTGERLHTAVQAVRKGLTERAKAGGVELTVANAVWPDTTVRLLDDYVATVGRFYGAGARTLDYQDALAESCHTINDWVSTATRERIPELVSPDVIGRDTRMVLTNAVYFLGPWQRAFDPDQTRDDEFKGPDGTLPVRMMTQTSEFRYASADWGQALELPYVGNDLSMLLLLPASERTPRDLEEQLSREWLLELDARLRRQRTRVEIPSFRMEFSCSLVQALKTLGVETAFTGKADFSGMTGMAGDLYVSDVLHKVFVEVMEKGTEAAAATAVVMVRTSAANPREPVVFRADRPFVFVIRDGVSSSVLFLGRVTRPKSPPGA
jgi:serpin B